MKVKFIRMSFLEIPNFKGIHYIIRTNNYVKILGLKGSALKK